MANIGQQYMGKWSDNRTYRGCFFGFMTGEGAHLEKAAKLAFFLHVSSIVWTT